MIAILPTRKLRQLPLFEGAVDRRRRRATKVRVVIGSTGIARPGRTSAAPRRVRETSQRPTGPDAEQTRILNALVHNASGMTDEELQALLDMPGNSERPRRRELERKGLVRDSGRRRQVRSGRQAIVWVATEAPKTEGVF